ncbi:hypothetical protein LC613_28730 [Nostoc sphaeroides CHAB 2801]|uniref:hypothetical protein n=1 Tax=Nostoc sphaeroides TaxID=446679 RepID=UPI000E4FCF65|nr:hypothetical protein [Nostoc sphaeroides]MCC5631706.1 hypothetical protein [Nostoc sphaeroides CHAB 2801]
MDSVQDTTQENISSELDLGIEVVAPSIDYEAAIAKTKPDFQRMVKLLGIQPTGSTQEEIESDILAKQTAYETDLKTTLVPKIQAALQGITSKTSGKSNSNISPKPGVAVNSQSDKIERKLKAWKGY